MTTAQPLAGKRIVVTRAADQASRFVELLRDAGAEVVEAPLIEIHPPASFESLDDVILHLDRYRRIIFTSTNGVRAFVDRLAYLGFDVSALSGVEVAVVGEATADALREAGITPDLVPPKFVSMALLPMLEEEQSGIRTAYVRAEKGRGELIEAIRERGGIVDLAISYETKPSEDGAARVRQLASDGKVDVVTFTSPSTVERFFDALPQNLEGIAFVSIGPTTTAALAKRGIGAVVEAQVSTVEGMVAALIEHFSR